MSLYATPVAIPKGMGLAAQLVVVAFLPVQHLAHPAYWHVHHCIRALAPDLWPVHLAVLRPHDLVGRRAWSHARRAAGASPALAVDDGHVGDLIHDILDAVHRKCQVARVVGRQRDVDVNDGHDQPRGEGQRPPAVRIVVDAELV